jgi:phosphoribosylformylglycinamidine synthase
MDVKEVGNLIYLVGITRNELGGSHYALVNGLSGGSVPRVDTAAGRQVFKAVSGAIRAGLLRSCHDLSEGGLAVAAAEMAFAGDLGSRLDAANTAPEDVPPIVALFSESPSRFLVEVAPSNQESFEASMAKGLVFSARVGMVVKYKKFTATVGDQMVVDESLSDLKEAWQKTLRW